MKKIVFTLVLFVFLAGCAVQKQQKAMWKSPYNIEVECLGVGQDGTKLVKVWAEAKEPRLAINKAEKNAISAALFKGIPPGNGAAETPAVFSDPDAYEKHKAFFDEFFQTGGKYLQFVNVTNDGMPGGKDRIKMEKGYKVAVKASIAYNRLREYMEDKGLVKRLDSGF